MPINNIEVCSCGSGQSINNYGTATCLNGIDVPRDVIFLSQRKVDGTLNGIDTVNDTLNEAFFDLRFKAEEVSDRWLMIKGVESFESPAVDPNTFDHPSGVTEKLSDGIVTVTITFPTPDPYKLKGKLDTMACRNMSVMYVDREGSLIGQTDGDFFIGRQIADGSLDVKVFPKTDTEASRVILSFQYERRAKDANVDFIVDGSMGGYSLSSVTPLADVNSTIITASLTVLVVDLFLDYGGVFERIPVQGLSATELDAFADGVVEPTASIVESTTIPGQYTFTYSAPISGGEVVAASGLAGATVQKTFDLKRIPLITQVASA